MKILKHITTLLCSAALFSSCENVLDLKPIDRVTEETLFKSEKGRQSYLAYLYYQLPVEDFRYITYFANNPFNAPSTPQFIVQEMGTDNAVHSQFHWELTYDHWDHCWDKCYTLIRDINTYLEFIPGLNIDESEKNRLTSEAHFLRAYAYYGLAKRYGGVPLITVRQIYDGDIDKILVPRSTEEATWQFILDECRAAAEFLPSADGSSRRATKWAAYALMSRCALHAASIAKFGENVNIVGEAADNKLVTIDKASANKFYTQCIEACEEIMNSGVFKLYGAEPVNIEEAAENYRVLFDKTEETTCESIFIKGFAKKDTYSSNDYQLWCGPNQTAEGWPHPGRYNPTLEWADAFETYENPEEFLPLQTVEDGNEDYEGFNPNGNYIKYDSPNDIFKGRDARLWAQAILPGTDWKNTKIIIQAGLITPDGRPVLYTNDKCKKNGKEYFTFGTSDPSTHSGFDLSGYNHTCTGFGFKKFLNQDLSPNAWNKGLNDYIDMRYAEILLNYAEAVAESGVGDVERAAKAMNAIRRRAGHKTKLELTPENVQRERRCELSFENRRFFDLVRRREFHTIFNQYTRHALLPILDLRGDQPKYIMVRNKVQDETPKTFLQKWYYKPIPGIGSNNLVQNPEY